jgi:hypothetical protein
MGEQTHRIINVMIDILGKRIDKIKNIGIPASSFYLFLRDLRRGFDGTKQDIEADRACI